VEKTAVCITGIDKKEMKKEMEREIEMGIGMGMGIPLRALIVEDSEEDTVLLVEELRRGGYDLIFERVDTKGTLVGSLEKQSWDIIFSDYSMPHFKGTEALTCVREKKLDAPFILVSGTIGEDTAVEAMRSGAQDYIIKGNLKRLLPAVERELREAAMRRDRKRADETVQYLAYHDVLTDLPNRALFCDRLRQALLVGHRESKPLALLLMDLNRFKEVNDTFGHHYGDLLLRQIGPRLGSCLRESDTVARIGGDEFAILLHDTQLEGATLTAKKVLKKLEASFRLEEETVEIGASIGIAFYPDHGKEAETLFQKADMAMYVTKQAGGGYAAYHPEHEEKRPYRLMLTGKLRRAIDYGGLVLYYQPQLNLKTNRVIGVEALARWPHPHLGLIPPDQFIPLAEQTGLIKPFTQWVLKAVSCQFKQWEQAGLRIHVSVNLSAKNLQETKLPDQVAEMIETGRLEPSLLEFEITESMIMADPPRALEVLTRLNALGISLSIDDFGAGYSSLGYLKKLPVQKIKIDKSFMMDRLQDENDIIIVKSIINMGHNLGLEVIAEGVEDQETQDHLKALGCDAVQGYYICDPLPSLELIQWIRESPWGI
jgi:diguanylate cyclase (GGDEF)-like protein